MGKLRMRDWAGCVLFLLICSPPSAPRFPLPCPALPALPCLPACAGNWNFQVGRERDQFASGGFRSSAGHGRRVQRQPPRVPVAARAGMKNWESSGYRRHARGSGLILFK